MSIEITKLMYSVELGYGESSLSDVNFDAIYWLNLFVEKASAIESPLPISNWIFETKMKENNRK